MLHSSDINDIVNAKWHYILSDEGHIPRPLLPPVRGQQFTIIRFPEQISLELSYTEVPSPLWDHALGRRSPQKHLGISRAQKIIIIVKLRDLVQIKKNQKTQKS